MLSNLKVSRVVHSQSMQVQQDSIRLERFFVHVVEKLLDVHGG